MSGSGRWTFTNTMFAFCVLGGCAMGEATSEPPDRGYVTEDVAPPPLTLLSASAISPTFETITWSASTSPDHNFYIVERGPTPDTVGTFTSVAASSTSLAVGHLTPNTQYCWGVVDRATTNDTSAPSNILCATTPAVSNTPAPADVIATAISDTRITLTWDAVTDATVYHVFFQIAGADAFTGFTSVGAPGLSVTAANLSPGTSYQFVVTAVTVNGESSLSEVAAATTFPAGLEGYWPFDERAGTTVADASGYVRDATLSGATFSTDRPPVNLLGNRSTLSISTGVDSQATTASQATFRFAGATFALAAWVKLAAATNTDFIGMQSPSCGALGWKLRQDASNGLHVVSGGGGVASFGTSLAAGAWTHVAFSYDAAVMTLRMYVNGDEVASNSYLPKNGLANLPLTIGHVGGCPGGGFLIDDVRIFSRTLAADEVGLLGRVPPAPTLTVTAPAPNTEVLSWTAVANASRYFVYKGTAAGNESFLASVSASSSSFTAQGLEPVTPYSWFVRTEVGGLDSPASNEVLLSTPDVLSAPVNVTATAQPPTSVAVSWSTVTGATAYQVFDSTGGGPFVFAQSVSAPTTRAVITNLASGTTYQFEVVALDAAANQGHVSAHVTLTLP